MGKRRNDGAQESKEEYEARQYREEMMGGGSGGGSSGGNGTGFSRASEAEMKGRRIIKVSSHSRWKRRGGGGGGNAGAGSDGANIGSITAPLTPAGNTGVRFGAGTASTSTSTNPFAKTVLTPSSKSITGNTSNEDSKPNPFSTISFASSATKPPSGGAGGFQFPTPAAKRSRPSESTPAINFGSAMTSTSESTSKSTFTMKNTSISPTPTQNKAKENLKIPMSEVTKANLTALRMAQNEYQANPLSDWSKWMEIYKQKISALVEKEGTTNATTGTTATTATTTTSSSSNGLFTFGKTAGNTTTTASSASTLASKPTPALPPKPTAASTSTSTSTTPGTNGFIGLENPEELTKVVDEDLEDLYECKAKYRKWITADKEWKTYSAGNLRISKSKSRNTYQLVIRDLNVGNVKFNVQVSKDLPVKEPTKSKGKGCLFFSAVQNEGEDLQQFMLMTKEEDIDGLFAVWKTITGQD